MKEAFLIWLKGSFLYPFIPLHGKERIIFINLEDERLLPLSFSEFLRFKKLKYDLPLVKYSGIRFDIKKALEEYLEWGRYPEVAKADEDIRIEILKSYFEMIVFRDIRKGGKLHESTESYACGKLVSGKRFRMRERNK